MDDAKVLVSLGKGAFISEEPKAEDRDGELLGSASKRETPGRKPQGKAKA